MVLTEEEQKQKKREWYEKNKQRLLEKQKEYYENNKEKIKQYKKEYAKSESGKETIKNYFKSPQGRKSKLIGEWKYSGVIHDNFDELYEKYIRTTNCEVCNKDLSTTKKCLDHDHDTGKFRYVLCNGCNIYDNWKNKC